MAGDVFLFRLRPIQDFQHLVLQSLCGIVRADSYTLTFLLTEIGVPFRQVLQCAHDGEHRVLQVMGHDRDQTVLVIKRLLQFRSALVHLLLQFPLRVHQSFDAQENDATHNQCENDGQQSPKPQRLPPRRQHLDGQVDLLRDTLHVVSERFDGQLVLSRRQVGELHIFTARQIHPIFPQVAELVPVLYRVELRVVYGIEMDGDVRLVILKR